MIIKKLKETLSMFTREQATSVNWPDITVNMDGGVGGSWKVECAIDEETVDCAEMDNPFTGIPAPAYLTDDEWFGPAVVSDSNKDYMEREYEATQRLHDDMRRESETKESEDIHQVMYEMATQSSATTLQLDPVGGSENFQGGSENVHR
jgi:hypothetical protein